MDTTATPNPVSNSTARETLRGLLERRYFVPACLGIGFLLRLLWIVVVHHEQVSDFSWYYHRGIGLATGQGYSVNGMPTAYWPAGYPLFLGGLFYTFGPTQFIGKFANVLFFCGTIWLAYLFARKVFRSEAVARITALLLAIYPGQIAYTSILTTEVLFEFLLVLGAVLFVYAEDRPLWWILSGLAWGLATLTKTQALFVPAIFLLVFLWRKKGFVKAAVLTYVALFLAISPWLIRNYRLFGKPLLSTNGGIVLMIGNNPYATGGQIWDEDIRNLLGDLSSDFDANHTMGLEVRREERARQVAVNFMTHHPVRDLLLWPKKFFLTYKSDVDGLFYSMGIVENPSRAFRRIYFAFRVIAELFYLAVFALFLLALPATWRNRTSGYRIPLYLFLYFTLVYCVYFGNARYHFAVMPFLMMYSAVFLVQRLFPVASAPGGSQPLPA
jgi:4-amino-4-deoxy-L-arabinose transferase-like glycosyltransferase